MWFLAPFFSNQSRLGATLLRVSGIYEGFQKFYPQFHGFCPDFKELSPYFYQIKTFRGALAASSPPPPTPVILSILHPDIQVSSRAAESSHKESEVFVWSWISKDTSSRSRIVSSDS